MRQPYWADYVLIVLTMQIASSLFAIATVLWAVRGRVRIPDSKKTLLGFVVFLYALWCVLVINMMARVLFVSSVAVTFLRRMVMAQIAVAAVTALISVWVFYLALRPTFHERVREALDDPTPPDEHDDAESPG